jgi:hypothetical protein
MCHRSTCVSYWWNGTLIFPPPIIGSIGKFCRFWMVPLFWIFFFFQKLNQSISLTNCQGNRSFSVYKGTDSWFNISKNWLTGRCWIQLMTISWRDMNKWKLKDNFGFQDMLGDVLNSQCKNWATLRARQNIEAWLKKFLPCNKNITWILMSCMNESN